VVTWKTVNMYINAAPHDAFLDVINISVATAQNFGFLKGNGHQPLVSRVPSDVQ
jgi:hypothetical protein